MKTALWIVISALVVAAFALIFIGPQMKVQPHIRTFQEAVKALPKGVVPVEELPALPSAGEARTLVNPLGATPEHIAAGKTYYGYYCLFCHGAAGRGDGPVGESYVPRPADLRTARIQSYPDGTLLRAMLTGPGHAPALERIVRPEYRWPIVLYVRSLASPAPATNAPGNAPP